MARLMMRMVGAGVVIGLCQWAMAGEAEDYMKYYSWWNGEWEVETKIGDEIESDHFVIQQHEPACHLVKSKGGISLWGYDPGEKKWVGTGFDADGRRFVTVIERQQRDSVKPGDVNRSKTVSWLPEEQRLWAKERGRTLMRTRQNYEILEPLRLARDCRKSSRSVNASDGL